MSAAPASVIVESVVKHYGRTAALDGISLDVEPGELFGVIGPDGAGKSTLFRILVTVLLPDAGTATLDGLGAVGDGAHADHEFIELDHFDERAALLALLLLAPLDDDPALS